MLPHILVFKKMVEDHVEQGQCNSNNGNGVDLKTNTAEIQVVALLGR